jgi:hypothetical protein
MKIKCTATLRKDLSQKTQDVYLITQDFELPIGKIFTVYAISIWDSVLHYLIVAVNEPKPDWYPADLFTIEDNILPKETYHKYFGAKDRRGVHALWGYKEMVIDDQHYVDLIEREDKAVEIFLKRKKEIDKM